MDSQSDGQEDQLSSWKAIADYLKSRPRTCIRWEKTLGLPIHRLEGSQKSRVFAYKHELDAWLQKKLLNGNGATAAPEEGRSSERFPAWVFAVLAVLIIAVIALYLIISKPKPSSAAAADGVPRSTGVMDMYPGDIITTEFLPEGKLRIWRKKNKTDFFEAWRMAPLRHTSLAVGDLDGDADKEIVAPGYCRDIEERDGQTSSRIRFFLNAYKRGVENWWMTTFYDKAECVYEKDDFEFTDIALADLDGVPGNEIVLCTAHGLSVFRYSPEKRALKLITQTSSFLEGPALHLRAAIAADIDNDGKNEILVTGNEWVEGAEVANKAWLIILKLQKSQLILDQAVPLSGNVSIQSLRSGDIVPGGRREVAFPIYRKSDKGWATYVTAWNVEDGFVFETLVSQTDQDPVQPMHLDIGDIMDREGDEIVIAKTDPNELICCFWNGSQLVLGPRYPLKAKANLTNVFVSPARASGNTPGRILTCGAIQAPGEPGSFYMEVVDYSDGFVPVWLRAGGAVTDIKVSYAAFGK